MGSKLNNYGNIGHVSTVFAPIMQTEGAWYQLRKAPKHTVNDDSTDVGIVTPVTVLPNLKSSSLDPDEISKVVDEFRATDDVYNSAFQSTLVVQQEDKPDSADNTCKSLKLRNSEVRIVYAAVPRASLLQKGPYFLTGGVLHEAWRLFPDTNDSFFSPVQPVPGHEGAFTWLRAPMVFGPSLAVAVPSRLYFERTKSKPLNGMRIAIKDNFDLKGMHTAVSNKSFLKFHDPANETAVAVQDLIVKGAIIVGKTKMTSFADREYPPSDWIDYHCPFNPRGDGYLVPEGSSTGSASAVATYNWLDAALGTDTSASLRAPAAAQGIFGLHTSYGAIPTDGVIPLVKRFDVAGFMARDISTMQLLARQMIKTTGSPSTEFPKKLIYNPDWSDDDSLPEAKAQFDAFVKKLEEFLGVKRTIVDIEKQWTDDNPMKTGKSFEQEFLRTYERIQGPASYEYQSAWAKKYAEKFGKAPYIPPAIKNRWPYVKTMTPEEVTGAHEQADAYREWFQTQILPSDGNGASSAVMVDRWTWRLNYRDTLKEAPNSGRDYGFGQEFSASIAELPELVICIGQYGYDSIISQTKEYAPVAVSLIGAKGSDQMLLKLAEEFMNYAGIQTKVLVGRTSFPAPDHFLPPDWHL